MPFYLFKGKYSAASMKSMLDKPQDREAAVRPLIESVGGKLHHLFFCFGEDDVIALIEAPDDQSMAAGALIVGASGSMSGGSTTKLMTAQEAMKAMEKGKKSAAAYKPATT